MEEGIAAPSLKLWCFNSWDKSWLSSQVRIGGVQTLESVCLTQTSPERSAGSSGWTQPEVLFRKAFTQSLAGDFISWKIMKRKMCTSSAGNSFLCLRKVLHPGLERGLQEQVKHLNVTKFIDVFSSFLPVKASYLCSFWKRSIQSVNCNFTVKTCTRAQKRPCSWWHGANKWKKGSGQVFNEAKQCARRKVLWSLSPSRRSAMEVEHQSNVMVSSSAHTALRPVRPKYWTEPNSLVVRWVEVLAFLQRAGERGNTSD